MDAPEVERVDEYLRSLQDRIIGALEAEDGEARFARDRFERGESVTQPAVLSDGPVVERSAVNFSHTRGKNLPPAATLRRPELAGSRFEAVSVSVIVHPRNPFAPTSHMNVRFFLARRPDGDTAWWFGGGFDLTPYYGFVEDAVFWHRTAKALCDPYGGDVHARLKSACDEYFYLAHRKEPRGIGGLFFDDLHEWGAERSFAFLRAVGDGYLDAYRPILARRKAMPHGEREREFQLLRRGRYVEFNLIYDRGTLFGLQSGGRVESILASLPPLVSWRYDWSPEPGSREAELFEVFLKPRDWANEEG